LAEIELEIQKTSFFGTINPEKMVKQITAQKNPPKNRSYSKYSPCATLHLLHSKPLPDRWLFNLAVS
jgi:hypothetical protein